MAKNQSTTKSETQSQGTSYRKIFRAFRRRVSPARRLATQGPIATNRADVKPSSAVSSAFSNKILIEYNLSSNNAKRPEPMKPGPVNNHHQQNQGPKAVKFQGGYSNNKSPTSGASNEKFSDFIDHVKNKIKANSSFVADENVASTAKRVTTRRDSFNDRVSRFINRAKLKMRTTTIGAGDNHGDGKLQPYVPR